MNDTKLPILLNALDEIPAAPAPSAQNPVTIAESAPHEETHEISPTCARLRKIHRSALDAVRSRERVPQPLFWSLLHSELKLVKAERKRMEQRRRAMFGTDF